MKRLFPLFLCLLLLVAPLGGGAAAAPAISTLQQPDSVGRQTRPRVISAVSGRAERTSHAGLGDHITVEVEGISVLIEELGGSCRGIVLFLGDIGLDGLEPYQCIPAEGKISFFLERVQDNDSSWHRLLGSPSGFERTVSVSVGTSTETPILSDVDDFQLILLPVVESSIFFVILVLAIFLLFRLAVKSAMLRNPRVPAGPGKLSRYSLARCQMAFWFFLTIAAYGFIWVVTGELDTITKSVLALLGIGAGTALGSSVIESGKGEAASSSESTAGGDDKLKGESAGAVKPEATPPVEESISSAGFLTDILSDSRGISLYRFQLVAWTVVLGMIFCSSVYETLSMPEFNSTLLGLLGISSGTYLGLKFPEQGSTPTQT